jgi:hypothetical protein
VSPNKPCSKNSTTGPAVNAAATTFWVDEYKPGRLRHEIVHADGCVAPYDDDDDDEPDYDCSGYWASARGSSCEEDSDGWCRDWRCGLMRLAGPGVAAGTCSGGRASAEFAIGSQSHSSAPSAHPRDSGAGITRLSRAYSPSVPEEEAWKRTP